jgi:hypothetical protein
MQRFLLPLLFCALISPAHAANNLYLLGITLDQVGNTGNWSRIGPQSGWKNTLAGTMFNNLLYTIDSDGILWASKLPSGEWKKIGKPDFANTALLFAGTEHLFTIEKDGSLYRIDPESGAWAQAGKNGDWKNTLAGAVITNDLFTIESSGKLWRTNLETGEYKQIGKPEFANTQHLFAAENLLYTIEKDGSLYRINPRDGTWLRVGPVGAWKTTMAATINRGQLYTVEQAGGLWFTDLKTGNWKEIGKAEFKDTRFMFTFNGDIYTIEKDGSLYRVAVKAGPTIDSFNWCTDEVEKLFKEQGNASYKNFESKHIQGEKASLATINSGLAWLKEKSTATDLAIIYIGAHGNTDPKTGWSIETADDKRLMGSDLKSELAKLKCPVLLIVETCTSGGIAKDHPNNVPVPENVMLLAACQWNQETNNQLDLALAEALYGRGDFNKDGQVTVNELVTYIEARYKEFFPNPKAAGAQSPVIVRSKRFHDDQPLTKVSPNLGAVAHQNGLWSALIGKQDGNKINLHILGQSNRPGEPYFITATAPRDAVTLPADGPPLLVKRKDDWVPARLLKQDGKNSTIKYLLNPEEESVPPDRIQHPFVTGAK